MLEDSATGIPSSSLWASMNSWFTPTVLFLLLNLMIATIAFISTFSNQTKPNQNPQNAPSRSAAAIARSPSLLQRFKSINFYTSPPPQDSSPHHKQIPDSDVQAAHYFFPQETSSSAAAAQESPPPHFISGDRTRQEIRAHLDFDEKSPPHFVSGDQTGLKSPTHFDLEEKAPTFADFEEAHEDKSMDEVYNHFIRTKSDTKPTAGEIPAKLPAKMRKSASVKSAFNHFEEGDILEARRPATVREAKDAAADDGVDAKADDFINRFKQQLKLQRLDSIIRYKDMIGRGR